MVFEVEKVKHIVMTQAYYDKIMKTNFVKFISPHNVKDYMSLGYIGCFNGVPIIINNNIQTEYEIVYK